jgi:hypothetical protein
MKWNGDSPAGTHKAFAITEATGRDSTLQTQHPELPDKRDKMTT